MFLINMKECYSIIIVLKKLHQSLTEHIKLEQPIIIMAYMIIKSIVTLRNQLYYIIYTMNVSIAPV